MHNPKASWWHEFVTMYTSDNGENNQPPPAGTAVQPPQTPPKDPPWKSEFGDNFDPDKAWELIQNLRRTERSASRAQTELEKKVKEFEDKDKTELEKLQGQIQELTAKNEQFEKERSTFVLQAAVRDEAVKAGAIYPDDVYRLIDANEFEMDSDGKVKNADKLVLKLKETRPQLFQRNGADAFNGSNNQSPSGGDMNAIIRRAAGRT